MYNNGGSPAFKDTPDYTAQPGAYQIDTGTDFAPGQQNFVIGLGGVDGNGRMKPLATVRASNLRLIVIVILMFQPSSRLPPVLRSKLHL